MEENEKKEINVGLGTAVFSFVLFMGAIITVAL